MGSWICICSTIAIVCYFLLKTFPTTVSPDTNDRLPTQFRTLGGYQYPLKGVNFAGLNDDFIGEHQGYIEAETDNAHDPHAIAVFTMGERVGYLPRGMQEFHEALRGIGGRAFAVISIDKCFNPEEEREFYSGYVRVP